MSQGKYLIFAGSTSPRLTDKICQYLGISRSKSKTITFSEGSTFVKVQENVRGRRVYLVQANVFPTNGSFMEILFWIDAFKRASAKSITVIMPYFAYAKGDKKDEPRVSIRARVCADAIEAAGANRVVTMDLHAQQIQGFFKIPVDDLIAMPTICDHIREENLEDLIIVSPDTGFTKTARKYANALNAGLAIVYKERNDHNEQAEAMALVGDVTGKTALLVDDFTISAGTLCEAANILIKEGAKAVYAAVSHGVFTGQAMQKLEKSPIKKLFVTNTIETQPVEASSKVVWVDVAPLFGEAIYRIHHKKSISGLFN